MTLDRPYQYGETFTMRSRVWSQHFIKLAAENPMRPVQAWTMGHTSEDRVVEILSAYLNDTHTVNGRREANHPTMRAAATAGMWTLRQNRHPYSEEARQRAQSPPSISHRARHLGDRT